MFIGWTWEEFTSINARGSTDCCITVCWWGCHLVDLSQSDYTSAIRSLAKFPSWSGTVCHAHTMLVLCALWCALWCHMPFHHGNSVSQHCHIKTTAFSWNFLPFLWIPQHIYFSIADAKIKTDKFYPLIIRQCFFSRRGNIDRSIISPLVDQKYGVCQQQKWKTLCIFVLFQKDRSLWWMGRHGASDTDNWNAIDENDASVWWSMRISLSLEEAGWWRSDLLGL